MVVPRDEHESDGYEEELVQLDDYPNILLREHKNRRDESTCNGEDRVHVPRASPETMPGETDDPDDYIRNEGDGKREEDIVL